MLNEDYKDILSALLEQKVDFILVGAYAMAAHGFLRATMDIDLWVRPNGENAQRVYTALAQFGAPMSQVTIDDFKTPGLVFQIGVAPCRIDILTAITGVEFEQAYDSANIVVIDGQSIPVLSLQHLVYNKQSTGRAKDLLDVEMLVKNRHAQKSNE